MSAVGIVTIALGVLVVCGRGALLVAPEAALGWFHRRRSRATVASERWAHSSWPWGR